MVQLKTNLMQKCFSPKVYRKTVALIALNTSIDLLIPLLCSEAISIASYGSVYRALFLLSGAATGVIIKWVLRRLFVRVTGNASKDFQLNRRKRILSNYFERSFPEVSQTEFARFSTTVIQDINILCDLVFNKLPESLASILFCFSALAVLLYVNFWVTLLMIAGMALFCIWIIHLKKALVKKTAQTARSRTALNLKTQELLRLKQVISLYSIEAVCMEQFKKTEKHYLQHFLASNILVPSAQSSIEIATMLAYVLVFCAYSKSGLSVGNVFLYLSYLGQIWKQFSGTMDVFNYISSAEVYAERVERACQTQEKSVPSKTRLPERIASICLQDISFAYEGDAWIFKDISMEIPEYGRYILVGASGSGKSTLFELLLGLRTPDKGRILFNGFNIQEVNVGSLHEQIGYVPQEKILFNGSVYDNIVLNRTVSRVDLLKQIQDLKIDHYFKGLENNVDTVICDFGRNLSHNQKAVISLLRAICVRPSVLLIDEITANLDESCKRDIERILCSLSRNTIVISITHEVNSHKEMQMIKIT